MWVASKSCIMDGSHIYHELAIRPEVLGLGAIHCSFSQKRQTVGLRKGLGATVKKTLAPILRYITNNANHFPLPISCG